MGIGSLLGFLNVIAIAIGLAIWEEWTSAEPSVDAFSLVVMFGAIPGIVAGAAIGWLAGRLDGLPPGVRIILLAMPAGLTVVALARVFEMDALVPPACIPTFVAVLVLERWTRRVPATIPVATARSIDPP